MKILKKYGYFPIVVLFISWGESVIDEERALLYMDGNHTANYLVFIFQNPLKIIGSGTIISYKWVMTAVNITDLDATFASCGYNITPTYLGKTFAKIYFTKMVQYTGRRTLTLLQATKNIICDNKPALIKWKGPSHITNKPNIKCVLVLYMDNNQNPGRINKIDPRGAIRTYFHLKPTLKCKKKKHTDDLCLLEEGTEHALMPIIHYGSPVVCDQQLEGILDDVISQNVNISIKNRALNIRSSDIQRWVEPILYPPLPGLPENLASVYDQCYNKASGQFQQLWDKMFICVVIAVLYM